MFDLKKSQGDPLTSDPSIKGPKFDPKVKKVNQPQICHPYGTRSKTKATSASVQSVIPDTHFEQRGHSGLWLWLFTGVTETQYPSFLQRAKHDQGWDGGCV